MQKIAVFMETTNVNPHKAKTYPSVGVSVMGVGIRSLASLPLFDFLEEEGIGIDLLMGTGDGSNICALRALRYSTEDIVDYFRQLLSKNPYTRYNYQALLSLVHEKWGSFLRDKGVLKIAPFMEHAKATFGGHRLEDLQPTTIIQTTEFFTGFGHTLTTGPLAESVYAGSALFPFVPPITLQDKLLIDGSFSSPVPVMEAVKRDIDVIIAILILEDRQIHPKSFTEAFLNAMNLTCLSIAKSQFALAIDMHHFEIIPIYIKCQKYVSAGNPDDIPQILDWGRDAISHKKEEIKAAVSHLS